jgi:hypothetical protein
MGIIRMGPPEDLVLLLKENFNLTTFVETGTFKGGTAVWAAKHVERVITIENSKTIFEETSNAYRHLQNIEFLYGDSRALLKKIIKELDKPALFWLDAHWCGADSYGTSDQCPIIEELKIIFASGVAHCVLIDDARLFLSPPPLPNLVEQWPTIDLVLDAVQSLDGSYYEVVFEDIIIAVPNTARSVVAQYCQAANTKEWNEREMRSMPNGLNLFKKGIRLLARDILRYFRKA